MPRRASQAATILAANSLGRASTLTGKFILAERNQVEEETMWSKGPFGQVGVVVNSTREHFNYPETAISQVDLWLAVDARSRRQERLDATLNANMERILDVLRRGGDVLVHCNQSFHRGPIIFTALFRRATGHSAQAASLREKPRVSGERGRR